MTNRLPLLPLQPCFSVVHREIDDEGKHHVFIEFRTVEGSMRTHRIPRGRLESPQNARVEFADLGAVMPPDWSEQLRLLKAAPAPIRNVTTKGGWHGQALATRHGVFGCDTDRVSFGEGVFTQIGRVRGDFRSAAMALKPILENSDYLIFALLLALAPALASRIGRTGGFGVCLVGESSTGKTLALRTAHSTADRAEESDLPSFGHTTGTILDSLPAFGGLCMCFGDVKAELNDKALSEKLRTLAFTVPGGTPRMRKGEKPPARPSFMITFISAERSMRTIFAENGIVYEDGEAVRMIELPIPNRESGGIFAAAKIDTTAIANTLNATISENYGTILPRFVKSFAKVTPDLLSSYIRRKEERFLRKLGELPAHHARIAKQFALLAAVGHVAVKGGSILLPFHRIDRAVQSMLDRALTSVREANASELAPWHRLFSIIDELPSQRQLGAITRDSLIGFTRVAGHEQILLRGSRIDTEIQGISFSKSMVPELERRGCLIRLGSTGASSVVKKRGHGRQRYYVFDAVALNRARFEILGTSAQGHYTTDAA